MRKYNGILSIDPGKHMIGYAIADQGVIVHADLAREHGGVDFHRSLVANAKRIQEAWEKVMGQDIPELVIAEMPQVRLLGKANPNEDILPLAVVSAYMAGLMQPKAFKFPKPEEWKGQVPKDIMVNRIARSLTEMELSNIIDSIRRVPSHLRHNCWDGVGIALWAMGRIGK